MTLSLLRTCFALLALATLTLSASAQPNVDFKQSTVKVPENAGYVIVEVVLSAASKNTVTVQYDTSDGVVPDAATAPADYIPTSGTLTFPPDTTSQFIRVPIVPDQVPEKTEYFRIHLSNAQNATAPLTPCLVYIEDGAGSSLPTVQFASASSTVTEGTANPAETDPNKKYTKVELEVTLSAEPLVTTTVKYAVTGGTASNGKDYTVVGDTLTFAPKAETQAGETSKKITILVVQDSEAEDNETVELTLSSPSGATVGLETKTTLTIMDDDVPSVLEFSASVPPQSNLEERSVRVSIT